MLRQLSTVRHGGCRIHNRNILGANRMNFKRKMKKAIKNLPVQSHEEWRSNHPELDMYFAPESTPKKRKVLPKWILAPASFLLVAAIVLPVVLTNVLGGGETPPGTLPPITNEVVAYGENDISPISVTQDYFDDKAETILIDLSKLSNEPQIVKETPKEETDLDLSYMFKEAAVPFLYEGNPYAFYITYRIRIYEQYSFVNEKVYENLENELTVGDYTINYQINETQSIKEGFAYFNYNDNDYYIYIKEAQSIWSLTDAALQALLQHLFID